MTITQKIAKMKKDADALCAASAIFEMDPHAREHLVCYINALDGADDEEKEYIFKAIVELLHVNGDEDGPDVDAWEQEVAATDAGKQAAKELRSETERFFKAYQDAKAKSGLTTVRAIAEKADLSPTTVHAIEKQRVKPQYKTVVALSKAFGVSPDVFH